MVTTVTATTTAGRPLSGDVLSKVEHGCDMALQLDDDKQQVRLTFGFHFPSSVPVFEILNS
jgi:hypothetical protein